MPGQTTGRIFVSYTKTDSGVALRIIAALKAAGLQPWIDQEEIQPGDSFIEKMNSGLTAASYVLLLVSPASLASRWVNREWMSALARQSTVLLPLLIERCTLPPLLSDLVYIDLTEGTEAGIQRLLEFFQRESRPATQPAPLVRGEKPQRTTLRGCSRRELRLVAQQCLDDGAFQAFLFDAEIESGRIAGQSLNERLMSLLHITATEGTLEHFADWLSHERPRCVELQLGRVRSETSWSL